MTYSYPPPPPAPSGTPLDLEINKAIAEGWTLVTRDQSNAVLNKGGKVRHMMHGIISLVTCGVWLWGWALVAILGARQVITLTMDENGYVDREGPKSRAPYLGGLGGLFVIFMIVGSLLPGSDPATDAAEDPASEASESAPAKVIKSPAAEESKKAKPKPKSTWKTVAKLSGSSDKASPDFHLNGCETRMDYAVGGGDMAVVNIYVLDSGVNLMEDGGFPEVAMADKSDTTQIRRDEGDYYLDVTAANTDWSVKIEEKC